MRLKEGFEATSRAGPGAIEKLKTRFEEAPMADALAKGMVLEPVSPKAVLRLATLLKDPINKIRYF